MKDNKLKATIVALTFGLGLGLSSSSMAAWWPSVSQCEQMQEACEETDDAQACNQWFSYYSYCMRIM
jgi:hypothetical protein